jgi:hypothetical protein
MTDFDSHRWIAKRPTIDVDQPDQVSIDDTIARIQERFNFQSDHE